MDLMTRYAREWERVSQKCPTLGGAQEMVDYLDISDTLKNIADFPFFKTWSQCFD